METFLDQVKWNVDALVPVIVTEIGTNVVLMCAWMNREALQETVSTGFATFWSRSRSRLWKKGEQSGHEQIVKDIRLDCDRDTILLVVEQKGGIACHTGRHHCFYQQLKNDRWETVEPVIKNPEEIYKGQ